MRAKQDPGGTRIWISARESYAWANKVGARWPCSELEGTRVFAEWDSSGNLVALAIDGDESAECGAAELNALTSDFLRERFGAHHVAIRCGDES